MSGTDKALMQELLCIADTDWVLGHWYIKVMLNGRSLPDCTAFAGMGQDSLGHTRAIFRLLEDRLGLPEHQLEFGRQPSELHDLEALSLPPQNWGDFLVTAFLAECAVWRLLSTFLEGSDKALSGMVKHFGKELYFHRLGLEGWMTMCWLKQRAWSRQKFNRSCVASAQMTGTQCDASAAVQLYRQLCGSSWYRQIQTP